MIKCLSNERVIFIVSSLVLCVLAIFGNQYYQVIEQDFSWQTLCFAVTLIVSHSFFASRMEQNFGAPVLLIALLGANDPMITTFSLVLYSFLYLDIDIIRLLFVPFMSILSLFSLNIISEINTLGILIISLMTLSLLKRDRYFLFVVSAILAMKGVLLLDGKLEAALSYLPFWFTIIALIGKSFEVALSYILFLLTGRIESFLVVPIFYSLEVISHIKLSEYCSFVLLLLLLIPFTYFLGKSELGASCLILLSIVIFSKFRSIRSA